MSFEYRGLDDYKRGQQQSVKETEAQQARDIINARIKQKTVTVEGAVKIIDIDIPFQSIVWLFVKIAFAVVPAALLVWFLYGAFFSILGIIGH